MGVEGIEFGPQQGSAFGIEAEGWAFVAEVFGPGLEVVGGVGEFEDAGLDEVDGGLGEGAWWESGNLLDIEVAEGCSCDFLSR